MPRRLPPLDVEGPPPDTKRWQLKADGLAERPKAYSMDDIRAFEPVKCLRRIRFTSEEELGYRETRGYPPEAGIPDEIKMKYGLE